MTCPGCLAQIVFPTAEEEWRSATGCLDRVLMVDTHAELNKRPIIEWCRKIELFDFRKLVSIQMKRATIFFFRILKIL